MVQDAEVSQRRESVQLSAQRAQRAVMTILVLACLLGVAMVARYLPDSRAVAAESGDAVDVSARDRG